jgi:hypothetical protein
MRFGFLLPIRPSIRPSPFESKLEAHIADFTLLPSSSSANRRLERFAWAGYAGTITINARCARRLYPSTPFSLLPSPSSSLSLPLSLPTLHPSPTRFTAPPAHTPSQTPHPTPSLNTLTRRIIQDDSTTLPIQAAPHHDDGQRRHRPQPPAARRPAGPVQLAPHRAAEHLRAGAVPRGDGPGA